MGHSVPGAISLLCMLPTSRFTLLQMTTSDSNIGWYVVFTKPSNERLAEAMLHGRLALQVYLPEVKQLVRDKARMTPFFPRYLFVYLDLAQNSASEINSMPGVTRLVEFAGRPQPVPADLMDKLRQLVDDYNAQGGLPLYRFYPGEQIRFASGPFTGLRGTFLRHLTSKQRVLVLLTFLGQENEIELDAALIERAPQPLPAKRPRRTRGKGRFIKSRQDEAGKR